MTELEIEKEIQARIEFKMNEFLTSVKNTLSFKYRQAFDMSRESEYSWKAFQEVSEILQKEIYLPTPCNKMSQYRKIKAKDAAVEKISKTLDLRGRRDYFDKIKIIVSAVEIGQDY